MLWIYTHDNRCYTDLAYLNKKFMDETGKTLLGKNIIYYPDKDNIKKYRDYKTQIFVAPYSPSDIGFENIGYFTVIDFLDFLTDESVYYGLEKEKILREKLGLRVLHPKTTFKDMAGASKLIEDSNNFRKMETFGEAVGGLFLFGIPGTGKSYFAECFAGETGRKLVDLDLTSVMYSKNPSKTLDNAIELLLKTGDRYVLWIDEIEKMFNPNNFKSVQVLGRLLTLLNEISKNNVKEIIFIATANAIKVIEENNPEFLRKGRFRKLYFLNFPTYQSAEAVFRLYFNKYLQFYKNAGAIESETETFFNGADVNYILKALDIYMQEYKTIMDNDKFIYTPAEINVFVKELILNKLLNPGNSDIDFLIKKSAQEIVPMQFSAKNSILAMMSQKEKFGKHGEINKFTEVS